MHREDYKILTQRKPGECHQETTLILDWSGMSLEDYQAMAKSLLVYNLQTRWRKGNEKVPEILHVRVADECHRTPASKNLMPPKPKVESTLETVDDKLDKLLKNLSKDEIKMLMGELADVE